mmetsp:Transcript_6280/g.15556  ORF Transcript_6280/g.15556 Transcript_6280/m.15556 type:complete len:126 (+) Transcript_6280:1248-1625(+)
MALHLFGSLSRTSAVAKMAGIWAFSKAVPGRRNLPLPRLAFPMYASLANYQRKSESSTNNIEGTISTIYHASNLVGNETNGSCGGASDHGVETRNFGTNCETRIFYDWLCGVTVSITQSNYDLLA